METLRLYFRAGCDLCEAMQYEIQPLQRELGFELELRDVDASTLWVEAYGDKVPVLEGREGMICHYFLDPEALRGYFAST